MRLAAIDDIAVLESADGLPIRLDQSSSRGRTITTVLLLAPVACACLLPFGLVAAVAASEPATLASVVENPLAAAKLLMGLAIALALVVGPARAIAARLGRRQTVEIGNGVVTVRETTLAGTRQWSEPVARFKGIAHYTRTSLSGSRQEIVLAHPDRSKSLLLRIADRVPEQEITAMARLLSLPVVPAREAFSGLAARG